MKGMLGWLEPNDSNFAIHIITHGAPPGSSHILPVFGGRSFDDIRRNRMLEKFQNEDYRGRSEER